MIRERLVPMAADLKITIAVEEVWNKFLLSPIEFARYVDDFDTPWVRAYFDVGNVVIYAFPQDWIRTLASRIVKIHLKDFKFDRQNGRFAWTLGEGHRLAGSAPRAQRHRLRRLRDDGAAGGRRRVPEGRSTRVDRILAGQKPGD